jgi:hypothetical protein
MISGHAILFGCSGAYPLPYILIPREWRPIAGVRVEDRVAYHELHHLIAAFRAGFVPVARTPSLNSRWPAGARKSRSATTASGPPRCRGRLLMPAEQLMQYGQ